MQKFLPWLALAYWWRASGGCFCKEICRGGVVLVVDEMGRPTICLNMIVRNESHIIHELIEAVAPFIDYWVIVDTGSSDGTQDLIRSWMRDLDIPGELHEHPWRDFGQNRTQALELARGNCDYIWVMDADDTVIGTPNFSGLTADGYEMLVEFEDEKTTGWRLHLFRDGVAWRYEGAIHELALCDAPHTLDRIHGPYRILARTIGGRSREPGNKYERDRDVLLAQLRENPDNARATFYLARMYECLKDFAAARDWYDKRSSMGGWDEEVYCAMYKSADMMQRLGEPWSAVMNAYLDAWAFRPTRSEGLTAIARHYRTNGEYELGYLFASRAAEIPPPVDETLVAVDASQWRALDEQSVCASWIGREAEAMKLCRRVLTRDDLPADERDRILENRELLAAYLARECAAYPAHLVGRPVGCKESEVTVTLSAGTDPTAVEMTLNSFLRCCTDFPRVGRFLLIDAGLAAADRRELASAYPFLDFAAVPGADLNVVRDGIGGRYWLHLWHGWRFFTEEALITRLIDVLEFQPHLVQVGINLDDALALDAGSPAREGVRTTSLGHRYVLSDAPTSGPAMFDMSRLTADAGPIGAIATLDEVLCVHSGSV